MELAVALLVVAVVAVALAVGLRAWRSAPAAAGGEAVVIAGVSRPTITIDVGDADPQHPALARLVDDAAARVFAAVPDATAVEVRSTTGALLGVREREHIARKLVDVPAHLLEPHERHTTAPLVPDDERPDHAHPHYAPLDAVPSRPLAERFVLPDSVRARVRDPHDASAIVVAILEAAGLAPIVDGGGEVLRVDGNAVIVVRELLGAGVSPDRLSHAYRLYERSGCRSGVVVTPGIMDRREVQRRETLAPALRHAGPDGIQRMADAVAVGADPLRLVAPPPLSVVR